MSVIYLIQSRGADLHYARSIWILVLMTFVLLPVITIQGVHEENEEKRVGKGK